MHGTDRPRNVELAVGGPVLERGVYVLTVDRG
jgi:hypothetical protein